jgi:hypothetical protein
VFRRGNHWCLMFRMPTGGSCFSRVLSYTATLDVLLLLPLPPSHFRHFVQASVEDEKGQIQLFLNSVPLLSSLRPDEKMLLVDAFQEEAFVGEWALRPGGKARHQARRPAGPGSRTAGAREVLSTSPQRGQGVWGKAAEETDVQCFAAHGNT